MKRVAFALCLASNALQTQADPSQEQTRRDQSGIAIMDQQIKGAQCIAAHMEAAVTQRDPVQTLERACRATMDAACEAESKAFGWTPTRLQLCRDANLEGIRTSVRIRTGR
jgi:hypothetical protein